MRRIEILQEWEEIKVPYTKKYNKKNEMFINGFIPTPKEEFWYDKKIEISHTSAKLKIELGICIPKQTFYMLELKTGNSTNVYKYYDNLENEKKAEIRSKYQLMKSKLIKQPLELVQQRNFLIIILLSMTIL